MRAREPDQQGHVEIGDVRLGYETFNDAGENTIVFVPIDTCVHSRAWKGQVALPRAALPRRHDRPAGQRTVRTLARPHGVRRPVAGGRHPRRPRPPRHREGRARGHLRQRLAGAADRGPASRPGPGRGRSGAVGPGLHAADRHPAGGRPALRRGARRLQRVVRLEPPLPARTTGRSTPRSSSTNMLPEPHSTKQLEDIHAYNCDTTGHVMLAENGSRRHPGTPEEAEALLRGIDQPVLVIQGTDDRCQPLGRGESVVRWTGGRAPRPRGRRPPADGTAPGRGQPGDQELRGQGHRCARPAASPRRRHAAPAAGALPQLADRARARAPRPRHRRRDARAAARPGDPVADAVAGGGVPRAPRRGRAPGLAAPRQRVGSLRVGVGRARPARLPGSPPHGRGAGQQLHGLRRPGRAGALRPLAGRRGLGPRPLPARAPRAQAGAVRLDDRLRRLGADARRRRAGGVLDLRLQRRDGRARRPLPAPA